MTLARGAVSLCTIVIKVRSNDEQVCLVRFGVGTGESDLLTKEVALVAGCHNSDCTLLDLHIDLVALEGGAGDGSEVLLNTDSVLLCLGPVCSNEFYNSGSGGRCC